MTSTTAAQVPVPSTPRVALETAVVRNWKAPVAFGIFSVLAFVLLIVFGRTGTTTYRLSTESDLIQLPVIPADVQAVSIGITVGAVSSAASEYYDLPEGLYISAVAEGSDAEKQGIQSGDMLLAVNGQAVTTTYDVSAVKDGLKVGDTVTLTIYRDGKTFDVDVKLVDTNDIS